MMKIQERAEHLMLGCNAMGWHSSASLVNELLQQRADLLEALKGICELYDTDEGTRSLPQYVAAISAINKAEALE